MSKKKESHLIIGDYRPDFWGRRQNLDEKGNVVLGSMKDRPMQDPTDKSDAQVRAGGGGWRTPYKDAQSSLPLSAAETVKKRKADEAKSKSMQPWKDMFDK